MTLVVDAGALYSQADRNDPDHTAVVDIIGRERGALVVSAFAAAEADYLILDRLGHAAEIAFVEDIASGSFQVECLTSQEYVSLAALAERFAYGAADLSAVILAARFKTRRILTLDERDFRSLTPLQGGHFTLLPADEG